MYIRIVYTNFCTINTGVGARLRQLEALFVGGPVQGGRMGHIFSIETLIDILLVLYDECCNSSLRREKTVSDFIEFGKFIVLFFHGSTLFEIISLLI